MAPKSDEDKAQIRKDLMAMEFRCETGPYAIKFSRLSDGGSSDEYSAKFRLIDRGRSVPPLATQESAGIEKRSSSIGAASKRRTRCNSRGPPGSERLSDSQNSSNFPGNDRNSLGSIGSGRNSYGSQRSGPVLLGSERGRQGRPLSGSFPGDSEDKVSGIAAHLQKKPMSAEEIREDAMNLDEVELNTDNEEEFTNRRRSLRKASESQTPFSSHSEQDEPNSSSKRQTEQVEQTGVRRDQPGRLDQNERRKSAGSSRRSTSAMSDAVGAEGNDFRESGSHRRSPSVMSQSRDAEEGHRQSSGCHRLSPCITSAAKGDEDGQHRGSSSFRGVQSITSETQDAENRHRRRSGSHRRSPSVMSDARDAEEARGISGYHRSPSLMSAAEHDEDERLQRPVSQRRSLSVVSDAQKDQNGSRRGSSSFRRRLSTMSAAEHGEEGCFRVSGSQRSSPSIASDAQKDENESRRGSRPFRHGVPEILAAEHNGDGHRRGSGSERKEDGQRQHSGSHRRSPSIMSDVRSDDGEHRPSSDSHSHSPSFLPAAQQKEDRCPQSSGARRRSLSIMSAAEYNEDEHRGSSEFHRRDQSITPDARNDEDGSRRSSGSRCRSLSIDSGEDTFLKGPHSRSKTRGQSVASSLGGKSGNRASSKELAPFVSEDFYDRATTEEAVPVSNRSQAQLVTSAYGGGRRQQTSSMEPMPLGHLQLGDNAAHQEAEQGGSRSRAQSVASSHGGGCRQRTSSMEPMPIIHTQLSDDAAQEEAGWRGSRSRAQSVASSHGGGCRQRTSSMEPMPLGHLQLSDDAAQEEAGRRGSRSREHSVSSAPGHGSRQRTSSMEPMLIRDEEANSVRPAASRKKGAWGSIISSLSPKKRTAASSNKAAKPLDAESGHESEAHDSSPLFFSPKDEDCLKKFPIINECKEEWGPASSLSQEAMPTPAPTQTPRTSTLRVCEEAVSSSADDVKRRGSQSLQSPTAISIKKSDDDAAKITGHPETSMETRRSLRNKKLCLPEKASLSLSRASEEDAVPSGSRSGMQSWGEKCTPSRKSSTAVSHHGGSDFEDESTGVLAKPHSKRSTRQLQDQDAHPSRKGSLAMKGGKETNCLVQAVPRSSRSGRKSQDGVYSGSKTNSITLLRQENDTDDDDVISTGASSSQPRGSRYTGQLREQEAATSRKASVGAIDEDTAESYVRTASRGSGSGRKSCDETSTPPRKPSVSFVEDRDENKFPANADEFDDDKSKFQSDSSQSSGESRDESGNISRKLSVGTRLRDDEDGVVQSPARCSGSRRQSHEEAATPQSRGSQRQSYQQPAELSRKYSAGIRDDDAVAVSGRSQRPSREQTTAVSRKSAGVPSSQPTDASRGSQPRSSAFLRAVCRFTHPKAALYCGLPAKQILYDSCISKQMAGREGAALTLLLEQAEAGVKLVRSHQGQGADSAADGMAQMLADLSAEFVVCSRTMREYGHIETIGEESVPAVLMLLVRLIEVLDTLIPVAEDSAEGALLLAGRHAVGGEASVWRCPGVLEDLKKSLGSRGFLPECIACLGDEELKRHLSASNADSFTDELDIHATLALRLALSWEPPSSIQQPRDLLIVNKGHQTIVDSMDKLVNKLQLSRASTIACLSLTMDAARLSICPRADMECVFGQGKATKRDSQGDDAFNAITRMAPLALESIEHMTEDKGELAHEAVDAALPAAVRLLAALLSIPAAARRFCLLDRLARSLSNMLMTKRLTLNLTFAMRNLVCRSDPTACVFENSLECNKIHKAFRQSLMSESLPSRLAVAAKDELQTMLAESRISSSQSNSAVTAKVREWSAQVVAAGAYFDNVEAVALKVYGNITAVDKEMTSLKSTCAEFESAAESGSDSSPRRRRRPSSMMAALGNMRQSILNTVNFS